MDAIIESGFILLFFNTTLSSHSKLSEFYSFFHVLPNRYFVKLKKLYIIHPNFLLKGWHFFLISTQNKILKNKSQYISKLSELDQLKLINTQIYHSIPQFIKAKDKSLVKFDRKNSWPPDNNGDRPVIKSYHVVKIIGVTLDQYEKDRNGIPIVIKELVRYFYENQEYLNYEGIFRKSAGITKENNLEDLLKQK